MGRDLNTLTRAAWADRIAAAWRGGVEAIIATGRDLMLAKEELPHGEFRAMVERELPFKASTARRLMAIALRAHAPRRRRVRLARARAYCSENADQGNGAVLGALSQFEIWAR